MVVKRKKRRKLTAKQRQYFAPKRRRVTYMRRRKRTYHKPKMRIPVLTIIGLLPAFGNMLRAGVGQIHGTGNPLSDAGVEGSRILFGIDPRVGQSKRFNASWLWHGLIPIILGVVGSKLASRTGLNRTIASVPLIKL